jgi:hypothetical protein
MAIANRNGAASIGALIRILTQQFLKFSLNHLIDQLLRT